MDYSDDRRLPFCLSSRSTSSSIRPMTNRRMPFRHQTSSPKMSKTSLLLLFFFLTIESSSGNVPQPVPPEDNTVSSIPDGNPNPGVDFDEGLLSWRPKPPFDSHPVSGLRIDGQNLSSTSSHDVSVIKTPIGQHGSGPSNREGMRYSVAAFDFNHVATPYIISLWIIIVGLAKIGKFIKTFFLLQ